VLGPGEQVDAGQREFEPRSDSYPAASSVTSPSSGFACAMAVSRSA
jgi:hypothetical protein